MSLNQARISWLCYRYHVESNHEGFRDAENLLETSVNLTNAHELLRKAASAQKIMQGLVEKSDLRQQNELDGYAYGLQKKLKAANRDIRDVVAHRCKAWTSDPTDREHFVKNLQEAYEKFGLDKELRAKVMLAYHKDEKTVYFISNNEKAAQAKGKKRGKRSRPNDKWEQTVLVRIHEDEPLDVVKLHPLERQQPDEKAPHVFNADAPEFIFEPDALKNARDTAHKCVLDILSSPDTGSLRSSPCTSPR